MTTLGDPAVVVAASLVLAAWAWWRYRAVRLALFGPAAVGLTSLVGHALKLVVERPRPATAVLAHEFDFSYPSGHATGATALALASILLLALGSTRRRAGAMVAAAYAAAICVSRLALGVHFLTDVVAAVLLGTAGVLCAGWLCSRGG
ncbi:MAG: phosphatase PAP2 family protein [Actinobacteria bacterium]|nr:phosphatase PAP2 family protein [Actinomycetota bacterium]